MWCRRIILVVGSTEILCEGNTQNHAHSFPAFGNFRSRAPESWTPARPFSLSLSYILRTDSMWFLKVPLMLPGRTVSRSLSPLPRTVTAILEKSISLILRFIHSRSRMQFYGFRGLLDLPVFTALCQELKIPLDVFRFDPVAGRLVAMAVKLAHPIQVETRLLLIGKVPG